MAGLLLTSALLLTPALLLPPPPASGDRDGLRKEHTISAHTHWVVPNILMQGDGTQLDGSAAGESISAFQVGSLSSVETLSTAVVSIEQAVRQGNIVYVHGGSPADEDQAALACACTLCLLYNMGADEACARVKGYCAGLRGGAAAAEQISKMDIEQVRRFLRKALQSDCADR